MKKLLQLLRDNAEKGRKPLNLVRAEDSTDATLYIYDVIDAWWGVSAKEVAEAIQSLDPSSTLHLRINSPGGDVFEGRAIATAIQQFRGKTIAHIDGLAASAATSVANAADEIEIVDAGFYMIHNAWTFAFGNKADLRETANLLEKVDGSLVADYARRTGASTDQIVQWMDAETWFTAQEAVDNGFATRIAAAAEKTENSTRKAFDLSAYEKTPKALLEAIQPPAKEPDYAAMRAHNERRLRVLQIA